MTQKKTRATVFVYNQIFQTSTIRDKLQKKWTTLTCPLISGQILRHQILQNGTTGNARTSYENLSLNHQMVLQDIYGYL